MARYDVAQLRDGTLVLDCQADALSNLNTRFVVPLVATADAPIAAACLNPTFEVMGQPVVMVTQFAAAIPITLLRDRIASLDLEHFRISTALDFLLSGY